MHVSKSSIFSPTFLLCSINLLLTEYSIIYFTHFYLTILKENNNNTLIIKFILMFISISRLALQNYCAYKNIKTLFYREMYNKHAEAGGFKIEVF